MLRSSIPYYDTEASIAEVRNLMALSIDDFITTVLLADDFGQIHNMYMINKTESLCAQMVRVHC